MLTNDVFILVNKFRCNTEYFSIDTKLYTVYKLLHTY